MHYLQQLVSVRLMTGLMEKIYMMLYEEESKGLDRPRMARVVSRDTPPSSRRLPKYPLPTVSMSFNTLLILMCVI